MENNNKPKREGNYKPPLYDPDVHPRMYVELASQGYNDSQIAARMDVSLQCLRNWSNCHVEFAEARQIGHSKADSYLFDAILKKATEDGAPGELAAAKYLLDYKRLDAQELVRNVTMEVRWMDEE